MKTAAPAKQIFARIYGRYSSNAQERGGSKREQIEGAIEYAKKMNFTIVGKPYFDEGVSGKAGLNLEKELGRYRREAKAGEILLVYLQDRFGRQNPILLTALIYEICLQGIEIHVWGENKIINAKNMEEIGGQISTFISSATGFQENQRKIKRLNDAFENTLKLARAGTVSANLSKCLPQVFEWNDEKKKFETNQQIKSVIKRIFREFNSGKGKTSIAQGLNQDKIPTLYHFNRQTIGTVKGWMETSIKKILSTKSYNGVLTVKGETFENLIEQIVDDATFNKAQMLLERYAKRKGNYSSKGRTNNLFVGISHCKHCKGTVNVNVCTDKRNRAFYGYRCKNAKVKNCYDDKKSKHPHKMLDSKYVELGFFNTCFGRGNFSFIKSENQNTELKEQIEALKVKITNLDKAIENLYDNMEQGDKDAAKRISKRRIEKMDTEAEIKKLEAKLIESGQMSGQLQTIKDLLKGVDVKLTNGKVSNRAEVLSHILNAPRPLSMFDVLNDNETRKKISMILPSLFSKVMFDCNTGMIEVIDKSDKLVGSFSSKDLQKKIKSAKPLKKLEIDTTGKMDDKIIEIVESSIKKSTKKS